MATLYARLAPSLQVSASSERLRNRLAEPANEDFVTARRPYRDEAWSPPADSNLPTFEWTGISLDGWVGVSLAAPFDLTTNFLPMLVRYKNTGSNYAWVFWLPLDAGLASGLSTDSQYMVLLPGQSAIVYARWTPDLYNDPAGTPGALGTHSPDWLDGTTVEVTVAQMDIAATMTAMGLVAA